MPNWCGTNYAIHGDKIGVERFKNILDEIEKNPPRLKKGDVVDNAGSWLGSLVTYCGGDYGMIPCRGWINYVYDVEESYVKPGEWILRIDVEDAWGPNEFPIQMLVNEVERECGVFLDYDYIAEEPGCGIYIKTNDKYFPEKYTVICSFNGKECWDTFNSDKKLISFVNEILETEYPVGTNIAEMSCEIDEITEDKDGYFMVYKYDIVDKEA